MIAETDRYWTHLHRLQQLDYHEDRMLLVYQIWMIGAAAYPEIYQEDQRLLNLGCYSIQIILIQRTCNLVSTMHHHKLGRTGLCLV